MYTVTEVAKKAGAKKEQARYFARIRNIQKKEVNNSFVFLFSEKDLADFLCFYKKKRKDAQPLLPFGAEFEKQYYCAPSTKKQKREELEVLLKTTKKIKRNIAQATLKVSNKVFEELLTDLTFTAPIAEDDRIDDFIYWVED